MDAGGNSERDRPVASTPGWLPEAGFWLAAAAFVVAAGMARSIGLNPHTLWSDDVWVGALTRLGLWDAIAAPTNAPPGFVGVSWLASSLFPDPELSLQVLPFIAALAAIPVSMLVVTRVTSSWGLGVAAGAVLVLSPQLVHYSVFVKQYSLEYLGVALTLLLLLQWADQLEGKRAALVGGVALITATLGYGAALAVAVLVNSALLAELLRRRRESARLVTRSAVALFASLNLALLVYYLVLLRPRAAGDPNNFWRRYFLPLDSAADAASFLGDRGATVLTGVFPAGWGAAAWLAGIGLVWLAWHRRTRWFAGAAALLSAGLIVASALNLYPIGARRTDIFVFPLVLALSAAGAAAVTNRLGPAREPARTLLAAVLAAVAIVSTPASPYYELDQSDLARRLGEEVQPADGIILHAAATSLAAFYSGIPPELLTTELGLPYFSLQRDGSFVLPRRGTRSAQQQIFRFLRLGDYPRVWFFSTRLKDRFPQEPLLTIIRRRGYRESERWTSQIDTHLILFERDPEAMPVP